MKFSDTAALRRGGKRAEEAGPIGKRQRRGQTPGERRPTQKAIEQAYLDSLQRGEKINVAELCRRARVNRGTFYNHFADIADVQKSLENELFERVADELEKNEAFSYAFFLQMMRAVQENAVLVKAVLDNIRNSVFFRNVVSYFRHKYVCDFERDLPALPREEAESLFTYILSGSIGLISDWLRAKQAAPAEEIAAKISRFNGAVLDYVRQNGTEKGDTLFDF